MANIFLYDEYGPEDTAMMQALYSRSPESVEYHVEKVKKSGSGKFMERFYVGYGHASIADCGSTTLFIEGISMLGAKAIQDWPLYSGQETSTRYIDMSKQPMVDPVGTDASTAIQKRWLDFYIESSPAVIEYLREKYPRKENEEEKMYEKAIKARSFDILRGFLPAGITTQLSWHTNLRQAWDKLALLRYHPLEEIREAAEGMIAT
jgi:thymidylate synthase ThyX